MPATTIRLAVCTAVIGLFALGCSSSSTPIAPDSAAELQDVPSEAPGYAEFDEADLPPLEPGDWSEFEGGVNPFEQDPEGRSAQALQFGSVTLNGAENTNPDWEDSPFGVTTDASEGDVALIKIKVKGIPEASNSPRARFSGTVDNFGFLQVPTNDTFLKFPLWVDNDQDVTLTMMNSAVDGGELYDEAAFWTYWLLSQPAEDIAEPNDDGDPATVDDREMGEPVPIYRQVNRSMYAKKDGTAEDVEDWFNYDLNGGSSYRFIFGTSSAIWGRWNYTVNLFDSDGQLVDAFENFRGITAGFNFNIPETGRYYIQVVGTPMTGRGNSMFYGQYALRGYLRAACLDPELTAISAEPPEAISFEESTLTPVYANGPITGWNWDFGTGATPQFQDVENPTVTWQLPGEYQGTVEMTNACNTVTYNFTYIIRPKLVGIDMLIPLGPEGETPRTLIDLESWTTENVAEWLANNFDTVFFESGVRIDPNDINLIFLEDRPEWYTIDSRSEFNGLADELLIDDYPRLRVAMIHENNWGGWAGIAFNGDCSDPYKAQANINVVGGGEFDYKVLPHEVGHNWGLPHTRTNRNPLTELNFNLMGYGTNDVSLSHNIDIEGGSGCGISSDNPMDQYQVAHDVVRQWYGWQ